MPNSFRLSAKTIGPSNPCYVIAEVAQSHDGSLGLAHAFIDAAADAGADAIKFQTHFAAHESTRDEPFRVKFSKQDETRFEYWKRMEFTPEQWAGLADHAAARHIDFLSSPFSLYAVDLLERLGVPAWKVGSGEFRSSELIDRMLQSRKPILYSTGMSSYEEVARAHEHLSASGVPFALLQCTSMYPTPLEKVGLNVLDQYRKRFNCAVGLSDHSGTIFPGLAAMATGADLLEVHVTFDRRMFGPDVPASVTFSELATLCAARTAFRTLATHPVDKDELASELQTMRNLFTKSLTVASALQRGTVLTREMLTARKPGTGIPMADLDKVIGRTLSRDVNPDRLLTWEDLQ